MAEHSSPRFRMVGARSAILDGPIIESIQQQIDAIEKALESVVPELAFDLSKTLVESICKTVLADLGQTAHQNWDALRLLKETTRHLSLIPGGHSFSSEARNSVEKTVRGMLQTIQGLCELRNKYGMASHGRDAFSARLDLRQATLAAQAADTIASFLYRTHRDACRQTPGERVYYEDHHDFNEAFDRDYEVIQIGEVHFLPSQVLFHVDLEAYKAALSEFIDQGGGGGSDGEGVVEQQDEEDQGVE